MILVIRADLNEVQRQMGECNHRYDLVGERLTHRQGEMEKTLADLKSYLIDVQQLMVYLNRAEPLVHTCIFCYPHIRLY